MTKDEVIAGALFDFMGWLTSRKERIVLSSADEASPAVDAIKDFAKMRGLSLDNAQVQTWQEALAQPAHVQEPVGWISNKDFEPIRIRIMQEAYELADRNDSEGYNAIKVMCGDVQRMLPPKRTWVGLTDEEVVNINDKHYNIAYRDFAADIAIARAIEAKLRSKNT